MARSAYALNGILVIVEYPHLLTQPLRRASNGTWLQQDRDTFNWFHFATATPIRESSENMLLSGIKLNGFLESARLDRIHLREGAELVWRKEEDVWPLQSGSFILNYPTGTTFQYLPTPDAAPFTTPGYFGYCLSVRVTFTGAPGQIQFSNATFEYETAD